MKKKKTPKIPYPYLKFGFSSSAVYILLISMVLTVFYGLIGYFILGFFMEPGEIFNTLRPSLIFGFGVILLLTEESWRLYQKETITSIGIPLKALAYAFAFAGIYLFLQQFQIDPTSESILFSIDFTVVSNLLLIEAYILQRNKHVRKNEQIQI